MSRDAWGDKVAKECTERLAAAFPRVVGGAGATGVAEAAEGVGADATVSLEPFATRCGKELTHPEYRFVVWICGLHAMWSEPITISGADAARELVPDGEVLVIQLGTTWVLHTANQTRPLCDIPPNCLLTAEGGIINAIDTSHQTMSEAELMGGRLGDKRADSGVTEGEPRWCGWAAACCWGAAVGAAVAAGWAARLGP